MFVKKADYIERWIIYSKPFTPVIHKGKMMAFATKADAEKAMAEINLSHARQRLTE